MKTLQDIMYDLAHNVMDETLRLDKDPGELDKAVDDLVYEAMEQIKILQVTN